MEPFLGEVRMFSGNYAPRGWAFCAGQLLPIQQNAALFSILGVTYGGDGKVNFALPDFRGRIPVHASPSIPLGQKDGSETSVLSVANMPAHTHAATATAVKAINVKGGLASPQNALPSNSDTDFSYATASGANDFAAVDSVSVTVAPAGGGQPLVNMMPTVGINFMIAISGIYPSRS